MSRVAETGSTNDDLFAEARAGAAHRSVLVADYQTAGKGRLDRTWEATSGSNLLVSMLFRYEDDHPGRFTRIVALAARAACRIHAGVHASLKWPNDLLVGEAKCGGLLAVGSNADRFVVVGIGINVRWAPSGATCLIEHARRRDLEPLELLAEMLSQIDQRLAITDTDILLEHKSALSTLGQRVRVEMHDSVIVGSASDVDADGRLVVSDEQGRSHVIDVGDVVHLRNHDA